MADALKQAAEWLHRIREQHIATTVEVYNGEETIEVPATIGRTNFRTFNDAGDYVRYTEVDFIVSAAKLVFGGVQRLPTGGWRFRVVVGLKTFTYQPAAPKGEQLFRYTDPHGIALRIHTKRIGIEE